MKVKGLFRRKRERGQAFVELALSMVFLLTLLSAVVDLGWAFYTLIALRDMAQEGAAYGSLYPCEIDGANFKVNTEITTRIRQSATAPITWNDPNIDLIQAEIIKNTTPPVPATVAEIASGSAFQYGNSVRVTVRYQHHIVTPFLGTFIGNNWQYPLSVNVSDTILQTKTKSGSDCH